MNINGKITSLLECPHCEGKGSCLVDAGRSCGSCLKDAKLNSESNIVKCAVCKGIGKIETTTERLRARMPFAIVITVLAVFYGYAAFNAQDSEKFSQIFPVIGSLTTMVATFYFSRK